MSLAEEIPRASPRFKSAEAFLGRVSAQPGRSELVDGVARMMTGCSPDHARLSRNVLTAPVAFPDVSVSCGPVTGLGADRVAVSELYARVVLAN